MRILKISKQTDIYLFFILVAFILLYQLQLALPWITTFRIRELLYVFLYLRILLFYKKKFTKGQVVLFSFFIMAVLISLYTLIMFNKVIAFSGLLRFINVALIAPLASFLFTSEKEIKTFMNIWSYVVIIGALTAIYQFLGGSIDWLVRDYIAIRGDLIRYKTILGEPNIGGMAAAVILIYTFLNWNRKVLQVCCVIFAIILLILSISKAAFGALAIGYFLIAILSYKKLFKVRINKIYLFGFIMSFCTLIVVLFFMKGSYQGISNYVSEAIKSFTGANSAAENSALEELLERLFGITAGIDWRNLSIFQLIFGGSFGIAGSAALQYNAQAILPHNSYIEVLLVGGVFYLIILILIIVFTLLNLYKLNIEISFKKALYVVYLLLIAYMIGYPVIYEPIMGSLFWLITGISANKKLVQRAEAL